VDASFLRLGQCALECGAVGRATVRRQYKLDRSLEQGAQSLGHLLPRHALAEPFIWDLKTAAEVDERGPR